MMHLSRCDSKISNRTGFHKSFFLSRQMTATSLITVFGISKIIERMILTTATDQTAHSLLRKIELAYVLHLLFFFLNMSKNKFVAKFTVTEAVAVQQLKDALPGILNEAFGNSNVYTLWGVPLDKNSEDERIKVVLIKFLRARYDQQKFICVDHRKLSQDIVEIWIYLSPKKCLSIHSSGEKSFRQTLFLMKSLTSLFSMIVLDYCTRQARTVNP